MTDPYGPPKRPRQRVANSLQGSVSALRLAEWRDGDTLRRDIDSRLATGVAADSFDPALVEWLAHRERSPYTRRVLCRMILNHSHDSNLCRDLFDTLSPAIRLWRFGCLVGAIRRAENTLALPDFESLIAKVQKSNHANIAFALCGLPIPPWDQLNREERAARLLYLLCARLQRGP